MNYRLFRWLFVNAKKHEIPTLLPASFKKLDAIIHFRYKARQFNYQSKRCDTL
jgi:hypothetical protein